MFSRSSGITALVNVRKGSAIVRASAAADGGKCLDPGQGPRIGHLAPDRRSSGGQRRREERPPALPLASLEVAARRGDRVLAGRGLIALHRYPHRAARPPPLRSGGPEDLVEAFPLGFPL